ncbi:response regulator [Methylobacterium symbioticum]|jgi:DNA-binding NtrC family response regulator|uniref:Hydrogenase transcriptional regulatory protein hupR1 n=1 Tax=Methylobacterium symbioticum TaxID=2584084 RepID=A0A509EF68_9HYPH|nr:response regulator [Methylobacterium symbioticum]VUD72800.1 Hydrogenase transcriptional regulatory protein hupR1 [Methylobacterium symbioticum]
MNRPAATAPLAVLLVEDVPVQMMAAAGALRDAGMRVTEAPTVEAATTALADDPDLRVLVADIDLGGEPLTGLTLAKAVAARWPDVSVLIVSGIVTPEPDALPAAARFLRKPFEPESLAEAVRGLVEARNAGRLAPDGSEIG